MEGLQEYYLQKRSKEGEWLQVTMSYESDSLVEAGKQLENDYPGSYRVVSGAGNILWQGKVFPQK